MEEEIMIGVYTLICTKNNREYIGESLDIKRRWKQHIKALKEGTHYNRELQEDFNKYGLDGFDVDVVQLTGSFGEGCAHKDKALCLMLEHLHIKRLKKTVNLYNIRDSVIDVLMDTYPRDTSLEEYYFKLKKELIYILKNCTPIFEDGIFLLKYIKNFQSYFAEQYLDSDRYKNCVGPISDAVANYIYNKNPNLLKRRSINYMLCGNKITEYAYFVNDEIDIDAEIKGDDKIRDIINTIYRERDNTYMQTINSLKLENIVLKRDIMKLKIALENKENLIKENKKAVKEYKRLIKEYKGKIRKPDNDVKIKSTKSKYDEAPLRDRIKENGIKGMGDLTTRQSVYFYLIQKYDIWAGDDSYERFLNMLFEQNILVNQDNDNNSSCIVPSEFSIQNGFIDKIGSCGGIYFSQKGIAYIEQLFISTP